MSIKRCPRCGSYNITFSAGGVTGTWWCKSCQYRGVFVVEEDAIDTRKRVT